jgi:peroxiredoxin Q/BCP
MPLVVGDKAPNFTLSTDTNKPVSLKDFKGKKVVLYFYPKDNTSGCTTQACDFRDQITQFNKLDTVVLGVSRDNVASHLRFKSKNKLPFILLADTESEVCDAYGVMVEKSMYGRKYMGIERSTFLIDEKGKITAIWRKVKVPGHVDAVLEFLNVC